MVRVTSNPELKLLCDKTISLNDLLNYAIVQKLRSMKAADAAEAATSPQDAAAESDAMQRHVDRYKGAECVLADLYFAGDMEAAQDVIDFAELYLFNSDEFDEYEAERKREAKAYGGYKAVPRLDWDYACKAAREAGGDD